MKVKRIKYNLGNRFKSRFRHIKPRQTLMNCKFENDLLILKLKGLVVASVTWDYDRKRFFVVETDSLVEDIKYNPLQNKTFSISPKWAFRKVRKMIADGEV